MNGLRKDLEEYLNIRRKLGFQLQRAGKLLHDFVGLAEKEGVSFITSELSLRWATQPIDCQPAWSAARLGIVRGFAQYQSVIDPRTEVPSQELLPYQARSLSFQSSRHNRHAAERVRSEAHRLLDPQLEASVEVHSPFYYAQSDLAAPWFRTSF